MTRLLGAFFRSILDLFHPKMLLLLLVPPLLALFVWGGLGYVFWDELLAFSHSFASKFLFSQEMPRWMVEWFSLTPEAVATGIAVVMALLFLLPMIVLTSIGITSVVVMPIVLSYMQRYYPGLERRGKGILRASIRNLIKSSLIYIVLWVVSLPFWMIPGFSVALPLLLNGYLNYRLFVFDILAEYSTPREIQVIMNRKRVDFLLLGVLTSALFLIPPLFLILPIFSALCFARYTLLELQDLRAR
ncbi:MAG: EI24 domain-containing protein [Pseudobdellovibrionaceae bacterium]